MVRKSLYKVIDILIYSKFFLVHPLYTKDHLLFSASQKGVRISWQTRAINISVLINTKIAGSNRYGELFIVCEAG